MRELMLDLDGKGSLDIFLSRRWILKYLGLRVEDCKVSHTANGWHVRLLCENEIDDKLAIIMQLALGSDYRREMCNLLKAERGAVKWNILFERKWKVNELGELVEVSRERPDPELSEKVLKLIWLGE